MESRDFDFLYSLGVSDLQFVLDYRFDLQLFAASEEEGRTEEPTEYKKKKAREEGNVAKSQELIGIIVFLLSFWTISLMARILLHSLADIMNFYLNGILDINITKDDLPYFFTEMIWMMARIVLPVMGVGVIAGILANVLQTGGFIFSAKKISLDFGKLISNVPKNFKKMFWSGETVFNFIKSILKVVGVFAIGFVIVNARLTSILSIPRMRPFESLALISDMLFQFVSFAGLLLLVFAVGDYVFQRWTHKQTLKMTKYEVKQEVKEHEGDPEIKAKMREIERRILSRRMIRDVPKADVVITNPTHYSIALRYDGNAMPAPTVIAKGEGAFALRIREVAKEHNVPLVENKPLARALYKQVEVGDIVPKEFFEVVANILAMVYKMKKGVA